MALLGGRLETLAGRFELLGGLPGEGVESEPAHDEQVEADTLEGLLGGVLDLVGGYGAVLGAERDGYPTSDVVGVRVVAFGIDPSTREDI